jgi:protein-tyrosine-phosphatase
MEECRIGLEGHVSKPVTPAMIEQADWVFTMTAAQRRVILELMPNCRERLRMLSVKKQDIPGAGSETLASYRKVRDGLHGHLRSLLSVVVNSG